MTETAMKCLQSIHRYIGIVSTISNAISKVIYITPLARLVVASATAKHWALSSNPGTGKNFNDTKFSFTILISLRSIIYPV